MKNGSILKKITRDYIPLLLLLFLIIIFSILSPVFFTPTNILNVVFQVTINGIMAIGMTFVIISGGFDLSIGYNMALSAILAVTMQNYFGVVSACLIAIASGIVVGLINGLLTSKAKINPLIATLGIYITLNGLILWYTKGYHYFPKYYEFTYISYGKLFYIPFPIWVFLLFIFIGYIVLSKTKYGKRVYAMGGDEEVCRILGINVDLHKISVYMISGFTSSISGIILASRANCGTPEFGKHTMFLVIGAVVLGGTSLEGGIGGILNSIIGVFIFGIIQNGLGFLNVITYYHYIIWGLILLMVIIFDRYKTIKRRMLLS
jgi:ribose transport system permease protein